MPALHVPENIVRLGTRCLARFVLFSPERAQESQTTMRLSPLDRGSASRAGSRARMRAAGHLVALARHPTPDARVGDVLRGLACRAGRTVGAATVGIYMASGPGAPLVLRGIFRRRSRGGETRSSSLWQEPASARVLVPLQVKGELLGLLVAAWSSADAAARPGVLARLEKIGASAAVAIAANRLAVRLTDQAMARERARLADALHDGPSQTLFSMGLKLELSLKAAENHSRLRPMLEAVKRDARMAMTQLRQLLTPVRPESPAPASDRMATVIQEFRALTGVPVLLIENAPSLALGPRQLEALAMVVESGLATVAQDARVSRAEIRLDVVGDELRFEVKGHEVDTTRPADNPVGESFSATMMTERVRAAGGRVEFISSAPATFRLHGALPLARGDHGEDPHRDR